jgi:hypothetical protein
MTEKEKSNQDLLECFACDTLIPCDEMSSLYDDVCVDCEDNVHSCGECSDIILSGDEIYAGSTSDYYCESCFDEFFRYCSNCQEDVQGDDVNYSEGGDAYCYDCYGEIYSFCYDCGEEWAEEELHYDNGDGYCDECHSNVVNNASTFIQNSPQSVNVRHIPSDTFNKLNVRRLIGVELECVYPEPHGIISNPNSWRSTSDSSIQSDQGFNATELVSIPANGNALIGVIDEAIEWSNTWNADVNKSCGMHVHVNAVDTDWEDLRAIAMVVSHFERFIFQMMPPSRQNGRWAKKLDTDFDELKQTSSEEEFVEDWYRYESISRSKYNGARYRGLNLHARCYLGTIEFRYHSGTMNKTKIINWIKICNSIVETGMALSQMMKDGDASGNYFFNEVNTSDTLDTISKKMIFFDGEMLEYMHKRIRNFSNEK